MKNIDCIIEKITNAANDLRNPQIIENIINRMKANCIEFDLKSIDLKSIIEKFENKPGLYLFSIKKEINNQSIEDWFTNIWESKNIKNFKHSPRIAKKRIRNKASDQDWIELYLGKTEKLQQRINDHINLDGNKQTFALKLKARISKLKNEKFKINWVVIDEMKEVQIILRILEEEIREIINPIAGRQ